MAWGSGSTPRLVGYADRVTHVNQSGVWFHWHDITYSFRVDALSEANADPYAATPAHGGEIVNLRAQEVDPSGQWVATWDEVVRDPAIDDNPNLHTGYQ